MGGCAFTARLGVSNDFVKMITKACKAEEIEKTAGEVGALRIYGGGTRICLPSKGLLVCLTAAHKNCFQA